MRKTKLFLLMAAMLLCCVGASADNIASGICGNNLTWELTDAGELIIEGTGDMYDYSSESAPWYEYRISVRTITIKEGAARIGNYAFNYCIRLASINLPECITAIGNWAFSDCYDLASITISENSQLASIGEFAFFGCRSLTSIIIPESVTSIGVHAFSGCSSLTSITCNAVTPPTIGDSETFFNVKKSIPVYVPASSVEAYKAAAYWSEFTNYQPLSSDIASGTCGDNLTWRLTEEYELVIEGTGDMYDYTQGGTPWNEFRDVIKDVALPEGITNIGDGAFYNCSILTAINIPGNVIWIGGNAFENCGNLISITIPEGEIEICVDAFLNTGWYNEQEEGWLYLSDWFIGYKGEIPTNTDLIIREGTKGVVRQLFFSNESRNNIKSVTIPSSVIHICLGSFHMCDGIESLKVAEFNQYYDSRNDCNAIIRTSDNTLIQGCPVTIIPDDITAIDVFSFAGLKELTSIYIPANVKSLGLFAFSQCENLTTITCHALIPPICNGDVFSFDKSNANLYVPSNSVEVYKSAEHWNEFTKIQPILIASGTCGDNLTWRLTEEYELVIEGTGDMYDYSSASAPWYEHRESIQTITMGEGVTSIGERAFESCSSLTSITIPASVASIGQWAFLKCNNLSSVYIPEGVSSIGNFAFSHCSSLSSIALPESTKSIGDGIFSHCGNLTSIVVAEENAVYDSRENSNVIIETSSSTLVAGCSTSVIPESVTNIANYAFVGLGFNSITIPQGVKSIRDYAFQYCNNLTSIVVDENNIVYDSRNSCNAIIETNSNTLVVGCSTTVIPESVSAIGLNAFCGCGSLTSITIPENVTSIGNWAFANCFNLSSITCEATMPPTIGVSSTFYGVDMYISVYVPAGSVGAYQASEGWSEFTNIQPIEDPLPATVTITINQYGSGTYSSEYALDFSEVKVLKAYVATGYNHLTGEVTLLRVHTAEAGMGLLVKGTPGVSYEVPILESTADHTLNMLVATLEKTKVNGHSDDGVYANYKYTVVKEQSPEPLFYQFADGASLSAGKAYLQIPVAWLPDTGQKSLRYRFDEGETTDIEDEEIINHKSEIIYDLYGRRVVSPKKGEVYIVNNQKVIY